MINRAIVRLKILQLIYANYTNGGKDLESAKKELNFSLEKSYDLYHYLLLLITNVTDYAQIKAEALNDRMNFAAESKAPLIKLAQNRFALQLMENEQLLKFEKSVSKHWTDAEDVIRNLYKMIVESDIYNDYEQGEDSYAADREFWRKAYKKFVFQNPDIDNALEEWSLYWNDDKEIIDTFVIKTIKRFEEDMTPQQPLLPDYSEEEDKEFAGQLFHIVLTQRDFHEKLIKEYSRNWDIKRIALMDRIIIECALAEILNFPTIDVKISMNEYINLAKIYSTPKSGGFVNGMLDKIIRSLREDGQLLK